MFRFAIFDDCHFSARAPKTIRSFCSWHTATGEITEKQINSTFTKSSLNSYTKNCQWANSQPEIREKQMNNKFYGMRKNDKWSNGKMKKKQK